MFCSRGHDFFLALEPDGGFLMFLVNTILKFLQVSLHSFTETEVELIRKLSFIVLYE